ncbi:hypothetical protein PC116_g33702 [Phytophthora cactorum]|nr:hypothetical protein PC116_g33702 [Phytophthora cactorum]
MRALLALLFCTPPLRSMERRHCSAKFLQSLDGLGGPLASSLPDAAAYESASLGSSQYAPMKPPDMPETSNRVEHLGVTHDRISQSVYSAIRPDLANTYKDSEPATEVLVIMLKSIGNY